MEAPSSANKTIAERVVRRLSSPEPIEGYDLVVYELIGEQGMKVRSVLGPGSEFTQSWKERFLARKRGIGATAVTRDSRLEYEFQCQCFSKGNVDSVTLTIVYSYSVSSPRKVVEVLDSDPVGRLEREGCELAKRAIAQVEWAEIESGEADLESAVLDHRKTTNSITHRRHLVDYAGSLGLGLQDIRIRWTLPLSVTRTKRRGFEKRREAEEVAQDAELERKLEESGDLTQRLRIKLENERSEILAERERNRERLKLIAAQGQKLRDVLGGMADALNTAMGRAGASISNVPEIRLAIQEVLSAKRALETEMVGQAALEEAASKQLEASRRPESEPIRNMVTRVLSVCEELPCDEQRRRMVRSLALHVIAEAARGEGAEDSALSEYGSRLRDEFVELSDAGQASADHHRQFFQELTNLQALKKTLSGERHHRD